jgi:hypothetical protein
MEQLISILHFFHLLPTTYFTLHEVYDGGHIFLLKHACGFGTSVEVLKHMRESIPVILGQEEELANANVCLSTSTHCPNQI